MKRLLAEIINATADMPLLPRQLVFIAPKWKKKTNFSQCKLTLLSQFWVNSVAKAQYFVPN